MPLYEGLAYNTDKTVVVLDIGRAYTKCGIAADAAPRCIIPSVVVNPTTGKQSKLWSFSNTEELYDNLKDFLFKLYFRRLLVNPKDRPVVVVESLLCPTAFKETLAKVLYKHYEVSCVLFAPCHMLSLLTIGGNIGLAIDVGYEETVVIPVYEGIPVLKAWQALPLGGSAIHNRMQAQLLEHGTIKGDDGQSKPVASNPEILTEDVLEDIKVRCCFVTNTKRASLIQDVTVYGGDVNKLPAPPPGVDYPIGGSSLLHVSGKIREHSAEVLFEHDNDERSIITIILDSLIECPVDTRKQLAENVIIMGGTAMMPGFHHRLKTELYEHLKLPKYQQEYGIKQFRFHQPPAKENFTAWLGGSMIGALETLSSRSLSREAYLQSGKVPDWCVGVSNADLEIKSPTKKT
ncbi:hypothetical protein LOTGIDRAFT_210889 [Lottia gigantea]|uniref:Actin-related protein 10 n=1 Tax=Lottia gigantea TaxID=225164 RepID=V3ZN10_LOTGI|nr:hypothetical protein LOTGIDRAFT_210889 [Lottia gigantea]ESO85707.1 hypothetical protein LOTGIDRAFT_210889 [Lottia gigantea]